MTNIYEPAAQITEAWEESYKTSSVNNCHSEEYRKQAEVCANALRAASKQIRALPNPPSELPMFTAEHIARYEDEYAARKSVEGKRRHHIAACINACLATFCTANGFNLAALEEIIYKGFASHGAYGPNPLKDMARHAARMVLSRVKVGATLADAHAAAGEPDLVKMQEAFYRAWRAWMVGPDASCYFADQGGSGAKYLAAEGFRLWYVPWQLNENDSAKFVADLENPPEPNAALRAGVDRYADTTATASKEDVSLGDVSAAGESPAPLRKVVQVIGPEYFLCDDGTFWRFSATYGWSNHTPKIPQPGEMP